MNDPKDHVKRLEEWGDNYPIVKPPKTIMELILENFEERRNVDDFLINLWKL